MYKQYRSRVYDSPKAEKMELLNDIEKKKKRTSFFTSLVRQFSNIIFFYVIKVFCKKKGIKGNIHKRTKRKNGE